MSDGEPDFWDIADDDEWDGVTVDADPNGDGEESTAPTDALPDLGISWCIADVGRRSIDYAIRDVLFGPLYRQPGLRRFQRLAQWYATKPPEPVAALLKNLRESDRSYAGRLLALVGEWHFYLKRRISDVQARGDYTAVDEQVLQRLLACWPVGALLSWTGVGREPLRKSCKLAWACPWCYTRRIGTLHKRLLKGPMASALPGRYLVQVSYSLPPELLLADPNLIGGAAPDELDPKVLAAIRVRQHDHLRQLLNHLGVRDGLLAHQVLPAINPNGQTAFRHDLVALGTADLSAPGAIERFRREAGIDGRWLEIAVPRGGATAFTVRVLVAAVPADSGSLRRLLFGTSVGSDARHLGLMVNQQAYGPCRWTRAGYLPFGAWLDQGVPGTFGVPPLTLLDHDAWERYVSGTAGLPLYRTFGDWRTVTVSPKKASIVEPDDTMRAVWREVMEAAQARRRGRPPYNRLLGEALTRHGLPTSRRTLTALVKQLSGDERVID
jgi:hypothetical protein